MIRGFVCFFMCLSITLGMAQDKKQYDILRQKKSAKIDGNLSDKVWEDLDIATDFIQYSPNLKLQATPDRRTEVKLYYNDQGIFLSAKLYDDPNQMMSQFTTRDDFGEADYFALILNPNNDAQNDTQFFVFSSGTQADALSSPSIGRDFGWNAVWESAVQKTDFGWQLEMKIPYRTLRFPKTEIQTWGVQFRRHFRRERSDYAWNPIDRTKGYEGLYHGQLVGLKNLEPPLRLNLYPFTTGIVNTVGDQTSTDFKLGLDMKYGITDNLTLDATLIPDFSQARFDNVVLNLGPFEQTFDEQRQFFTEGVDLFTKGDLFFSRRVGSAPSGKVNLGENEIAQNRPDEVGLINAIKMSGRLKSGLGVGVFNAVTESTNVRVLDTFQNESRSVEVEPLANYNILVVDQQFNKNSSVSLINTNVTRSGDFRNANVTGALFDLINESNSYQISGEFKMSHLNLNQDEKTGFSSKLRFAKISDQYQFSLSHDYADKKYDINDLGLLFRNNFNNFTARASYRIFEPTDNFQSYSIRLFSRYSQLASPQTFTGLTLYSEAVATSLKLDTYGIDFRMQPGKQYDYFEPRVDGRFFITENQTRIGGFLSSNYNRTFAINLRARAETFFEEGRDSYGYEFRVRPRIRFNNSFLMEYNFNFEKQINDRGFATFYESEPVFGERDRQILTNSISANYIFNPFHGLNLQLRHYWDTVLYDEFMYDLNPNGRLSENRSLPKTALRSNPDINFSTWNVDLNYSWQFAPGSFLTALYRNQLFTNNSQALNNFETTFTNLFQQDIQHTVSVRLQYFFDVNTVKSVFASKKS
ncbi:carbohydrate binding family 9 domain-containing protein [Psychroflexus sp. YR1-1]|uniref:Carbohydrate binding family 9 domain-containing protein n=2 Tax=Psychroflexus aurantiacus TaxID=2709310 RepID=A0A6B3R638_9FLAO|nr:carbohydrate binding family 9 domain-containing protein [Psychroflexus aurantiacus]